MYKYLATPTLIFLFSANILAQTFEPVNLDDYEYLVAVKSHTDPIAQIKDADGKLVKNVRIPDDGLYTISTYDNKYLIVHGKQAIHRVAIYNDETITVPYNMTNTYENGISYIITPILGFTQASDKAYFCYEIDKYGPSVKKNVDVYEVDFKGKSISHHMTLPINSTKYSINGSLYNKYLIVCAHPGKIDLYNIEDKTLFKSINLDLPENWANRAIDSYACHLSGSEFRYIMSNSGISDSTQIARYTVAYNLSSNKIKHAELRTGQDAKTVFTFQPNTEKIYWTKYFYEGDMTQWKSEIFDDQNLSNMIFEFTGVMTWQFDKNDPNLIDVTYHTGKIETYNLTTKKLVATKNNGGGMNDF